MQVVRRTWAVLGKRLAGWLAVLLVAAPGAAEVRLPALFSDHAVLQRDMELPVWGWAAPGEKVKVTLPNQQQTAVADSEGRWQVKFHPLSAGGPFDMVVEGTNRLVVHDVQVGEVWLCSGQSNMEWTVANSRDGDLEVAGANYPNIRLITVGNQGSQTPVDNFSGKWELCTPQSVADFSAVGYFFGRDLLDNVKVPIGLIDNSWGGSACEAWVRRDLLEGKPLYDELLKRWDKTAAEFDVKAERAKYEQQLAAWQQQAEAARRNGGKEPPGRPEWNNPLESQYRPANLYHARIKPLMPYAIRGAIWYQGETNGGRGFQYRDLFPLMIKNWRDDWGQGEFPFYFVQLADFNAESPQPADSAWAELREAQTMTLDKSPHTGQAVIVDLGAANDIHPRNKRDVARRLARQALAKTYGQKIAHESARYKSMYKQGNSILIRFDHVNGKLQTVDGKPVAGFAIAGADRKWKWADAKIVNDSEVEVRSDEVADPMAVRYAWADNPVCNLIDAIGLPVTPFRTDQWPGATTDAR